MAWSCIDLPGAELAFDPQFLDQTSADAALSELTLAIAWQQHRVRMFGREHLAPRLSCWIGDAGARYSYSNVRYEPMPWPAALVVVREKLEACVGAPFNAVLANLYRDGRDAMGWHADDERELGTQPVIASLSLGASRRFSLRGRGALAGSRHTLELGHGSLLVMRGDTQKNYHHALPRSAKVSAPRLNLTFRLIN